MAASGIAEHNEARRKEMCMQKQAFKRKNMMMQMADRYGENPDLLNQDTYEQEVNSMRRVGSPPGRAGPPDSVRHDAAYVDQMRRNELRQQQLVEYSAKIPNRYSSIDYISQW